jgi:uncharacterized FlgJ-related protein
MGRTKHFETDTVFETIRQAKRRKSVVPSGGSEYPSYEQPDFAQLCKHLQIKLWRTLLSMGLSFHALTKGVFRKNGFGKSITIAICAYLLLFSDHIWVAEQRRTFLSGSSSGSAQKTAFSIFNDAAPVGVDELAEAQARDYIERFAPVAIAEMKRFGIPASISLAQGLVESRAGHSTLAKRNNNHFGIKCFSRKCQKGHCSNHTDDTHKDFFRIFKSPWDSWRSHSQMLANGRYAQLKKHGHDYKAWAEGLKALGYATDKRYDSKLIGMIEKYQLSRYDQP